jgi:hypothetical protein
LVKARSITLKVAAAAAVALLALPASALAQTGGAGSASLTARAKPPVATTSKTTCTQATPSSVKQCTKVQRVPLSALSSSQRTERSSILKARAAKAKADKATPAASAALPAAPDACVNGNISNPDRFDSCADAVWTVETEQIDSDGTVTIKGTFTFEDQQWTTYSATSQSWTHGMYTIGYDTGNTGDYSAGVSAQMYSGCYLATGICTAISLGNPDPQSVFIPAGGTQEFAWTEYDDGPSATTANSVNTLDIYLGVTWEVDSNPATTIVDTGVLFGRCDTLATSTDGCVDEAFTPTLYPSYAQDGAAADMINFYEKNIAPWYGDQYSPAPQPLHRLVNSIVQSNNREVICDKTFTPDSSITAALAPYNDTDSCDEYPFASTYESGAMVDGVDGNQKPYVTTGANCAQETAVHTGTTGPEPADWSTITKTSSGSYPCIRAHIPNLLNGHVGSEYSALIRTSRLIDKDAFWVQVTP